MPRRLGGCWWVDAKAELPKIRLHDLHHSYATLGLRHGTPTKLISDRLGHANSSVAPDIYTHVESTQQCETADRLAGLIFGAAAIGRDASSSSSGELSPEEEI